MFDSSKPKLEFESKKIPTPVRTIRRMGLGGRSQI